ncbi:MAG TPA: hypothetical protein VJP77_03160 [Planctomycetota bacterium]|nr:hypothetical protein [Planctomycetota bacterium]
MRSLAGIAVVAALGLVAPPSGPQTPERAAVEIHAQGAIAWPASTAAHCPGPEGTRVVLTVGGATVAEARADADGAFEARFPAPASPWPWFDVVAAIESPGLQRRTDDERARLHRAFGTELRFELSAVAGRTVGVRVVDSEGVEREVRQDASGVLAVLVDPAGRATRRFGIETDSFETAGRRRVHLPPDTPEERVALRADFEHHGTSALTLVGDATALDLELGGDGILRLRVVDRDGRAVAGEWVSFEAIDAASLALGSTRGRTEGAGMTDEAGRVALRGFRPGTYAVRTALELAATDYFLGEVRTEADEPNLRAEPGVELLFDVAEVVLRARDGSGTLVPLRTGVRDFVERAEEPAATPASVAGLRSSDGRHRVRLQSRPDGSLRGVVLSDVEYLATVGDPTRAVVAQVLQLDGAAPIREWTLEVPTSVQPAGVRVCASFTEPSMFDSLSVVAEDIATGMQLASETWRSPHWPVAEVSGVSLSIPPGRVRLRIAEEPLGGCGMRGPSAHRLATQIVDLDLVAGERRTFTVELEPGGRLAVGWSDVEGLRTALSEQASRARRPAPHLEPGDPTASVVAAPRTGGAPIPLVFRHGLGQDGNLEVAGLAHETITALAPGDYTLAVTLAGFEVEPVAIRVTAGAVSPVELVWRRVP